MDCNSDEQRGGRFATARARCDVLSVQRTFEMNRAVGQSNLRIKGSSRTQVINRTLEFATSGWVVEANLASVNEPPDRRFFAVGLAAADEAVEAVLRYPGLAREDRRLAIRPLSPDEISNLRLRAQAVRPYGNEMKK
jgi:hypothetical protein